MKLRAKALRDEIGVAYFRDYQDGERAVGVVADAWSNKYGTAVVFQFVTGGYGAIHIPGEDFAEHYERLIPKP